MVRIHPAEFSCGGREQGVFRTFQDFARQVATDRGKALQKFFERVVVLQILKESLHRNTRAFENRRAAENPRISCNEVIGIHIASLA